MTNDAFFDALTACKDQFTWTGNETGYIRATHVQHPDRFFCPWTALALTRGYIFPLSLFWKAAWHVGRTAYPHAVRMANIADSNYSDMDAAAVALRTRMKTCLGLEETTP